MVRLPCKGGYQTAPAEIKLFTYTEQNFPTVQADIDSFSVGNKYAATGTISLKHDSGMENARWGKLLFRSSQPIGTSIRFRTRTAETDAGLAAALWSDYCTASGSAVSSPPARWMEVEATLSTTDTDITPLLHEVSVSHDTRPGEILWQTDLPVHPEQGAPLVQNSAIGTLGITGKLFLQGTLTSGTGQTVATDEHSFYVEPGNFQLLLAPDRRVYRPGETATIHGEVWNSTSVDAAGVLVQVAGGAAATLFTETTDLPANSVHRFSFTTTAGPAGIYGLSGAVTRNNTVLAHIVEQLETADPAVSATLSAPDTAGIAPVTLSLSLHNAGKVSGVINVGLTDDSAEALDSQEVAIPAGETRILQWSREIAGATTFTALISGDLNQTLTKKVAYEVSPLTGMVGAKIVTDKISYPANSQVALIATATAGTAIENLSAFITVSTSNGQVVHSVRSGIALLNQGQTTTINNYWNTATYAPGSYLVTLQISNAAGIVIAKSTCNLAISSPTLPGMALKGTITLDKRSILSGEPVTVSYSVTNAGNADLSDVALSVQTVGIKDETVFNTVTAQASLAMGATHANSGVIDTGSYSARDYLVVLRATVAGMEETIGSSYFRVEGAPSAPALAGPGDHSDVATLTPQLTVGNAADPNGDRLTYQVELFADGGLSAAVVSGAVAETGESTTWTVPVPLTENRTYYWRARAYDGRLYGPWMASASFRVNTANDPPAAPTVSSPADSTAVAELLPVITVSNASDPDSATLTYNFEVALDPDFAGMVASSRGIAGGEATTSWRVPQNLQENTLYYWRAQADDWLVEGPWSATARFFVNTSNDAPAAPVVIAPAGGSTVAALATDAVVANSADPDSPLLSYYFEADAAPTFDSPDIIRSGSVTEGEGTTFWRLEGLKDNTRYHLRVKASDGAAESPWSVATGFFANTVNDPPAIPVLANPSNGAGVNVLAPVLSVHNAADFDGDALSYQLEIYPDAAMANPIAQSGYLAETPGTTGWQMPSPLAENETYYWRARAFDGALHSAWTAAASFMVNTANDAPGAPRLSSPAEGQNVLIPSPALAVVNAVDPDSDSLTYDFEIYSSGLRVAAVAGVAGESSGFTTWTPDAPLADNTQYQWRARAHDGDSYGPWTAMATFTVRLPKTSMNAAVDFAPDTLNKAGKGTWVVAYIELPAGYQASGIDISSVRMEGSIPAELRPYAIGDHDRDGIADLMLKFNRSELIDLLAAGERVPVQVTGKVGAMLFQGVDVIRVIE